MIKSQPILPIRFYSDLHEQDRFNPFHKRLHLSYLNYPTNEMPKFQITRERSLALPELFVLKNVCSDLPNYNKLVPEQASVFGTPGTNDFFGPITCTAEFDDGVDQYLIPDFVVASPDCNKLVSAEAPEFVITQNPHAKLTVPTGSTERFTLKLIVDKFDTGPGSIFKMYVRNGATTLDDITAPGVYTYNFESNGSDTTIEFESFGFGDLFVISYLQCIQETGETIFLKDYTLNHDELEVRNTTNLTDIIGWCGPSLNYNVNPGEYYYMIKFDDGSYIYSEVFNLKSYSDIENFYKLTWWNSVDINKEIAYDPALFGCEYKNILYLDASLFNPEYDTTTENVKNGENDDVPVFSKWQKSITLQIVKAPEFLADVLSSIFLHDNIYLRNPLNKFQEIQSEEYEVLKATSEISSVLDDSFQKVELKLLLSDQYTKSNCEESVTEFDCASVKTYVAAAIETPTAPYYLIITGSPGDGLYRHSDNALIEVEPTDIIYDVDADSYVTLEFVSGNYQIADTYPSISSTSISGSFPHIKRNIIGVAIPNTFVKVQYNFDGGGWVDSLTGPVDEDGNFEVSIPNSLTTGATDFDVRVVNITLECIYGTSSVVDVV